MINFWKISYFFLKIFKSHYRNWELSLSCCNDFN